MRTAVLTALALIVCVSGVACKGKDKSRDEPLILPDERSQDRPTEATATRRIALVMKTLTNPFFKSMEKGARRAEQELKIQLVVKSAADDASIEQQIAIVQQLIRDKVDAIVIVPGHSTEMIPVVKQAQDAGIEIVNIDNRFDEAMSKQLGLRDVPFVSVDNERGAYLAAKYLASKLTEPTEVAIIGGDPAAQAAKDRQAGARRAFSELPNANLVADETAHWKIDEAHDVASRMFAKHPEIGAIFCSNDMMALGAIRYLDDVKKQGVLVASYDDIEQARAAIKAGKLVATVNQQADQQGYVGVKHAMRLLAGETLPAETLIDVELVTEETLRNTDR